MLVNFGKSAEGLVEKVLDKSQAAGNALYVGCFLGFLQAADGVLTSMGVSRFGTSVEGNPLLRTLMEEFGQLPTLAILKALALFIVLLLTLIARRLPWVNNAMGAVSCVYLFAAVIPWTYILFIKGSL